MNLHRFYKELLEAYGPQGWWPLMGFEGTNPTKTGSITGYHPGDYHFPRNESERFEICAGAILTQNTAWPNVEKALRAMAEAGILHPEGILASDPLHLAGIIRPSGYHNAKSRKLKALATFVLDLAGRTPDREALLEVWGIGPETADSIRCYAYGQEELVVDAYTRRIFVGCGWAEDTISYEALKQLCRDNLPRDRVTCQEFHALMVEHAKRVKAAKAPRWDGPVLGG